MNRLFLVIALVLSFAARAQNDAPRLGEILTFKNGDVLYGTLVSVDRESGVTWTRPDLSAASKFNASQVAQIQFPLRPAHNLDQTNHCRVRLTNDDELEGNIVELNDKELLLDTWYAGRVHLPRSGLLLIVPTPASKPPIFTGPVSLEGWTMGKVNPALGGDTGEWKFKNQALYATKSASIARIVNLPDSAKIEFDLAWKGFFHLAIAIYTDYLQPVNLISKDTEPNFGGFYSLQINNFSANLLPVKKDEPLRYLGQSIIGTLNQKSSAHFDIRANKEKRLIALLIDGVLVKTWIDTDSFAGNGKGLRFVHQGQGSVKMSNIKVSEWDGVFDDAPVALPNLAGDTVFMRAGQSIQGRIAGIQNGTLKFVEGSAAKSIALADLRHMQFASAAKPQTVLKLGEARAYFATGGAITGALELWNSGSGVISSPRFGKLEVQPAAFSRLEF